MKDKLFAWVEFLLGRRSLQIVSKKTKVVPELTDQDRKNIEYVMENKLTMVGEARQFPSLLPAGMRSQLV